MKPAADTHPRTCVPRTPAPPDRPPRQPEHPAGDLPGTTAEPGYTGTFRGRAEEAARVRREIAAYLGACPATDDIVLIADELAANAIIHSRSRGGTFRVRCQLTSGSARIEVEDLGGPWRPRQPGDRPTGWTSSRRSPAKTDGEPRLPGPGGASCGRGCHGDGTSAARRRSQAPARPVRHRRGEHPRPAPAQRVDPGTARRADGVGCRLHRVRRRRPPGRAATPLRLPGNREAGRHLRRPRLAAHHPVRHLRRTAATRIRLPGLRSRTRQPPPARRPGPACSPGGQPVSTRADGATVIVTVSACVILSAGTVRISLTAREGPAPGNLAVQPQRRHQQPRRTRTHRREDRPPGRPTVRCGDLRRGIPARHHRTRPPRTVRRRAGR